MSPCLKCLLILTALVFFAGNSARADEPKVDADFLLVGGTIHDGSGQPPTTGDVAIRDDKIVALGRFAVGRVGQTIDCRGLIVAPGFIDLHNHSDQPILAADTRANVNYLTQGCTTIVTGNCGFGPVDVRDYLDKIDLHGAGTNVAHLLPHGNLRSDVIGAARRRPSHDELHKMERLAEQAMRDGAWGMSTGLIYVPGVYSDTDELIAIARVVGRYGGLYASHIRGEGTDLLDSVREALKIGQEAGLPVHVSHFKASGHKAWGGVRVAASVIEQARKDGQRVTADQYPYAASSTSLEATLFPAWAREGGPKALRSRLEKPESAKKIADDLRKKLDAHEAIQLARYAHRPDWQGKTLAALAESEHRDPVDLAMEIERHGGASVINFGMQEEDVRYVMTLPWVATASDGRTMIVTGDQPHPRNFGTFSRKVGRYSIEEHVVPLEQAIRSCTSLPAEILGLADRGTLRVGALADVIAFDPATFRDHATYEIPFRYSTGMQHVFVNGKPAIYRGTPTGALAGKALRHLVAKPEVRQGAARE